MFRSIGWQELAIVLLIVLVLFGPKRLPQLGKMFGKTMRNVKDGIDGKLDEENESDNELTEATTTPAASKTAEESKDKEPVS